jgi:hypothetical protein
MNENVDGRVQEEIATRDKGCIPSFARMRMTWEGWLAVSISTFS